MTGRSRVTVRETDEPAADPAAVRIDVAAAGVTFPDLLLTRGAYQYKPDLPFVPGVEVAGVVRAAPPGSGFSSGQRVAAFPSFGGFAEVVDVDPGRVFPLPGRLSFTEACALPMNYLTMHFALTHRTRLRAGDTVLVHGTAVVSALPPCNCSGRTVPSPSRWCQARRRWCQARRRRRWPGPRAPTRSS